MHETIIQSSKSGAYRWEAPLKDYNNLDKLSFPQITVDYENTNRELDLAQEVFDGILTVRLKGAWWWTLGLTQTLSFLRGLEQMMYDMYDFPDELHALMAFLRDGQLAELDFLEENNLLSLNIVRASNIGYTFDLKKQLTPVSLFCQGKGGDFQRRYNPTLTGKNHKE
jgi:hypothetical protein